MRPPGLSLLLERNTDYDSDGLNLAPGCFGSMEATVKNCPVRILTSSGVFSLLFAALLVGPSVSGKAQEPAVQVIEMTAKKYEYSPSPVRVKQGSKVQLKITAIDHDHGFAVTPYAEGAPKGSPPGLEFPSGQTNWKLEKGEPVTIEFIARSVGTYPFKCSVFCGFGHHHMKGEIIVEP